MDTPVVKPPATGCPLAVHISSLSPTPSPYLSFARLIKYPSAARNQGSPARWSVPSMPRFKPAATKNPFRCRRRGTLLPHSPTHLVLLSSVGPLGEAARPQLGLGISLLLTEGRGSLTRPSGVKSSPLLSLLNSSGSNQQRAFHSPRGQGQLRIRTLLSASLALSCHLPPPVTSVIDTISPSLSPPLSSQSCASHTAKFFHFSLCFSDIWRLAKSGKKNSSVCTNQARAEMLLSRASIVPRTTVFFAHAHAP